MYARVIKGVSLFALFSPSLSQGISIGGDSDCDGASLLGYCCDGSIIGDGNIGNNNDVGNAICCVGDPGFNIINSPGDNSCTAGTPTPLTAVGSITSSDTQATASSTDTQAATSNTDDIIASGITSQRTFGTTVSNHLIVSDGTTVVDSGTTITGDSNADTATQTTETSSSSTGGAFKAAVTAAPVFGGAVVAGALAIWQ